MFHRFLVFFKASRKFALGFPDITLVTIFARDRVDGLEGQNLTIDPNLGHNKKRVFCELFFSLSPEEG